MRVLKFGGSSVATPDKIRAVAKIIENHPEKEKVVTVSAFQGVTNDLTIISQLASVGDFSYSEQLQALKNKHLDAVSELITPGNQYRVASNVQMLLNDLENFLHGIYLIKELSNKSLDYVLSFGERLSAYIISKSLKDGVFVDISTLLKTDSNYGNARVNFDLSEKNIRENIKMDGLLPVVPGFIGSTKDGITTTLGRGGGDYTAAAIAYLLNAEALEIWTDVDGFMTADPRKVEDTYSIESLSYAEAMELSHFGAKVLYTPTVQPVYLKNIPIQIKNTLNPSAKGTLIHRDVKQNPMKPIKGIASIEKISLITLNGSGMVGVTGTSMRLFRALATEKINVILISQASSESSITFAISPEDEEGAKKVINEEFTPEIVYYKTIKMVIENDLSIIAIVGENMKKTPGIAGKLFGALGRNGVNVIAIAQGSSELNISAVVSESSLKKALNVVHEWFFLSDDFELHLFQIGVGTVGSNLLRQLAAQQDDLLKNHHLKIKLVGLSNSKKMVFDEKGIDIENYKQQLMQSEEPAGLTNFVERIGKMNLRNSDFIDCTANDNVAELYEDILNKYSSIVTANKIACSSDYDKYKLLKATSLKRGVKFLYETNVGAGLPILRTISDLIKSGDKIQRIEAVLSGTLTFIFNTLSSEIPISKAIRLAKEKGYSEPDPRLDLSGLDVLRKLLILARESNYGLEKQDVNIKSFLTDESLNAKTLNDFWEIVKNEDEPFEKERKRLESENKKWRYVASFDGKNAEIKLMEVNSAHPFYNLEGSDNIILINTNRYKEQPLIIKGAGAGAAVTATGLFADIIRIANI